MLINSDALSIGIMAAIKYICRLAGGQTIRTRLFIVFTVY